MTTNHNHRQESEQEKYGRYLERVSNAGNWFMFFRDYTKIMSLYEAAFLQSILNWSNYDPTTSTEKALLKQGWIRFSISTAEYQLGLKENTQQRIINKLKKKEFCKTRRAGIPPKRYFKINLIKIQEAVDKALEKSEFPNVGKSRNYNKAMSPKMGTWERAMSPKMRGTLSPKTGTLYIQETVEETGEAKTPPPPPFNHFSSNGNSNKINQESPVEIKWASELRKILRSKIPPSPVGTGRLDKWADEFKSLLKKFDGDEGRIIKLLGWYSKNINKIERPTILNARQFCNQFCWLEDLMNRRPKNNDWHLHEKGKPRFSIDSFDRIPDDQVL